MRIPAATMSEGDDIEARGVTPVENRSVGEQRMATRYWRIRGYEGLDMFFDKVIPVGCLTTEQLKELIKCMTAKASLSYDEIIGAYVKRRTKLAHDLLHIGKNGPYPEYSCGNNPHFTAIVVDDNGNRIEYPRLS